MFGGITIGRILVVLLCVPIGFLMVWKTQKWLDIFGHIATLEEKLGSWGGTRMFYKLLGMLLMAGAVLYATGALPRILTGIFGGLFRSTT